MDPRISIVTLGVRDLARSTEFYRDGLGLPQRESEGEIADYLDAVADCGGLGILAGHSAWETVTTERVGAVVDAARERGIQVTTVREALGL